MTTLYKLYMHYSKSFRMRCIRSCDILFLITGATVEVEGGGGGVPYKTVADLQTTNTSVFCIMFVCLILLFLLCNVGQMKEAPEIKIVWVFFKEKKCIYRTVKQKSKKTIKKNPEKAILDSSRELT